MRRESRNKNYSKKYSRNYSTKNYRYGRRVGIYSRPVKYIYRDRVYSTENVHGNDYFCRGHPKHALPIQLQKTFIFLCTGETSNQFYFFDEKNCPIYSEDQYIQSRIILVSTSPTTHGYPVLIQDFPVNYSDIPCCFKLVYNTGKAYRFYNPASFLRWNARDPIDFRHGTLGY